MIDKIFQTVLVQIPFMMMEFRLTVKVAHLYVEIAQYGEVLALIVKVIVQDYLIVFVQVENLMITLALIVKIVIGNVLLVKILLDFV